MGHIDDSGKSECQGESAGKEKEEGSHGNPVKGLNHPIHDELFLSGPLKGDGFEKNPSAALRFNPVVAVHP
jgi:hypothetical protein